MAYIAKVINGTDVSELRIGVLTDIPESVRDNWRTVTESGDLFSDPLTEVRYISSITVSEPNVYMVWTKIALPSVYCKMRLKDYAASVRWTKSQAGITLPDGTIIDTSESSKAKIDQALTVLEKGWTSSINWKAKNGWVELDLTAMTAIAQAVVAYEQACFNNEQAVDDNIESGTYTTKAHIDSHTWP